MEHIPEQDAIEVLDFIGYLNMKREREAAQYLDIEALSRDEELIRQVQHSREDRDNRRVYDQQAGLDYLREMYTGLKQR
ncbi:hypothetical protein ASG89_25900 [Paenibacillus sp. Soil766]|nr:hypothetical protein ASG89_25900 [Paenibacillus sp. Soil766]